MSNPDPIPEWLTVEEVAKRWSKKFNVPADVNYVLKCYGELRLHFPNPKKRSEIDYVPYSRDEFLELVKAEEGFAKFLDFLHELPRFEMAMLRVHRDDLRAFEAGSAFTASTWAKSPSLAHAGTVPPPDEPFNGGGSIWVGVRSAETEKLIEEQATYWARRRPAPLFTGSGFSDEALKQTTLTRYLDFDTWRPLLPPCLSAACKRPSKTANFARRFRPDA